EAVVQRLEVVEIADDDAERLTAPARPLELGLEQLMEAAPIQETGELVGYRRVSETPDQPVHVRALQRHEAPDREEGSRGRGRPADCQRPADRERNHDGRLALAQE